MKDDDGFIRPGDTVHKCPVCGYSITVIAADQAKMWVNTIWECPYCEEQFTTNELTTQPNKRK